MTDGYNSTFGLNTQTVPPFDNPANPFSPARWNAEASNKHSCRKCSWSIVSPLTPSMNAGDLGEYFCLLLVKTNSAMDFFGSSGTDGQGDLITPVIALKNRKKKPSSDGGLVESSIWRGA